MNLFDNVIRRIKKTNKPNSRHNFNLMTALVAEDSLISAVHVECILKNFNLKVDLVQNGKAALEKVREKQYDILLLGVHMPEMDGLETTKQIRSIEPAWCRQPILLLSAVPVSNETLESHDIDGVIVKPFSNEGFSSKIFQYLR